MLRKIWGAILLPIGTVLYVLSLPLFFVFFILSGIFGVLYSIISFLCIHKGKVKLLTLAGCVIYALASFESLNSFIYTGIAIVIFMLIFSAFYDKVILLLESVSSSLYDVFDGIAEAVSDWKHLLDYALLNVRGLGGKSEIEIFKLSNSNYYQNHDLFEDKFMKKYGRKMKIIE